MKKIAVILASILAAVSFSSCNKEIAPETAAPAAGQKIVLNLGAATKTTYEGNTTTWNAEDEISVFICKHGTKESASWTNYKFVCEDAAAGKFSCEIDGLSATEDYDMFAFYPYFENWTKPDSIGFNIAYNQKINGIDGKSGAKAQPLWGAQTTGQKINALSMNMKQGATFFKFGIEANDDITISSITMTAPEGIYPGTSMVVNAFDGSVTDGRYKQSSVTATVTGGIIEAGERGEFTMLVRPFALAAGQKLECVIATTEGDKMTFELTAPAAGYNFEAGKVNTIERTFAADPEKAVSLPYTEAFDSSIGDFTIQDVSLSGLTYVWKWASKNYGVKGSAYYNNASYAAESWLVSPLLDLSKETNAYLSFDFAMNQGSAATYADCFYINVIEGTKETKVAVADIPSTGSWNFISVKDLDLSAFCGKNVKIAFVYKSTTTSAPTVEIKNVKVSNTSSSTSDPVTPTPGTPTGDYTYTWDLSTDCTTSASTTEMTWNCTYASMAAAKASSTVNTNNYYPGTSGKTYNSTRFYTNSTLTITPASGYKLSAVVFTAATAGYATALANSTWTNASASVDDKTVTVTPVNGAQAISATIGATTGHTSVVVYCNKK